MISSNLLDLDQFLVADALALSDWYMECVCLAEGMIRVEYEIGRGIKRC